MEQDNELAEMFKQLDTAIKYYFADKRFQKKTGYQGFLFDLHAEFGNEDDLRSGFHSRPPLGDTIHPTNCATGFMMDVLRRAKWVAQK